MDRADLIGVGIRFAAAAALSFLTVRYMVKFLDPNYPQKEENKKRVAKLFEELGLTHAVELNEHELRIATQFIGGDESGVDWEEIGGCDELITELKDRIILPLQIANENQDLNKSLLCPPRGVLLYGPPGVGKTLLAKAVAKAAHCRFINLEVSHLTDKWYGESGKNVGAVFSLAAKFQPVIIFIDEIDSFLRERQSHDHEATAMMKAQFMTLWDGFSSTNDQIIVMGATNRPQDVDAAILRRLPARFHVDLPTQKQRTQIFQVILRDENLADDIDFQEVAKTADKLSGSDIKEVCRLAVLARAKATLADGGSLQNRLPLRTEDLINAANKYRGNSNQLIEHNLD